MIIYLATTIARRDRATYPEASDGPPSSASLFGLAPCGVYPASDVTTRAVRSYRTFSPLPPHQEEAVCFLWHFPSRHRDWGLPSALPWGVRTFLRREAGDHLVDSNRQNYYTAARKTEGTEPATAGYYIEKAPGTKSRLRRVVRNVAYPSISRPVMLFSLELCRNVLVGRKSSWPFYRKKPSARRRRS